MSYSGQLKYRKTFMPQPPERDYKKLIIDLGNTRAKVAVYQGDNLVEMRIFENPTPEIILKSDLMNHSFKAAIISSVSSPTAGYREVFPELTFIEFDSNTPVPITNCYLSPSTLGADRLSAAVAAHSLYPTNDTLVIDAGTAITFDFTNKQGEYLGGGITAGVSVRFKGLHTFTQRLPLVEAEFPEFLIGRSSHESILSGVMNGIRAELDGIIQEYKLLYPELVTIFTGGDMFYFEKKMKNDIFAAPNLVLTGLNLILEYNLEK
ncbi:MAG: pantothenate kinase [Bacteroidetes bacterium HGW-Bacteroidetes-11]|jgi:type III pantothenate kinase|nr:MAG: pantothenate kinase [Bacteroidetes bacterium HGW-Bacteroidetes-11]